jgi:bis(5'-nucleosyl)-tetraphosphatase (symmetrical)
MANYMIGDIQGCDAPLEKLLQTIDFSPSRDTIYLLGDLINRGPENLATLNRLIKYGTSAVCLLGNHDLHFLGIERGFRGQRSGDTLADLLSAPNKEEIVAWIRTRSLAIFKHNCLMVHAGVHPQWSVLQTLRLARELESALQASDWADFLKDLFGNHPDQWHEQLLGAERARATVNILTRIRFCSELGTMEFGTKGPASNAPEGFYPWFAVPSRQTKHVTVAFGHWSALNPEHYLQTLQDYNVLSLDTGCVWGGCLSAVQLNEAQNPAHSYQHIQVKCAKSDMSINRSL